MELQITRQQFFRGNWAWGIGAGLTRSQVSFPNQLGPQGQQEAQVDGLVRRYLGSERYRFFLGGGLSAGYGLRRQINGTTLADGQQSITRTREETLFLRPFSEIGLAYFVTNRVGFELRSRADVFPFQFSSLSAGLFFLTGRPTAAHPVESLTDARQTRRGSWVLSGTVSLQNEKNSSRLLDQGTSLSSERNMRVYLAPGIGRFVADNTLVGLSIGLSSLDSRNSLEPIQSQFPSSDIFRYTRLELRPFVRRYLSQRRLRPFVGGSAALGLLWNRQEAALQSGPGFIRTKKQDYSLDVSGGLAYLVGQHLLLEATLANLAVLKDEDISDAWTVQGGVTLKPAITVNYVFGK
ncbi:hypothetical protein [Tellurirhabdus rosea]|uniref:hypothetical protein n=1 Tax=Tellurirhabdus rosea TaxID=2674997 RepID=UPI00225AEB04|nr:hypothetical protein [Tellurirhabdus rosea]